MRHPKLLLLTVSIALACACRSTQSSTSTSPAQTAAWSELPAPVLYARDGSVVPPEGPARATGQAPLHDVGAREGTRMYLLELYQTTVEEKEALARETESLQAAVARAVETQSSIEKERDAALERAARFEKELASARSENGELAARLVTAQIRRLEAEKLLLEARIDALRRGDAGATSPVKAATAGAPSPHGSAAAQGAPAQRPDAPAKNAPRGDHE